MAVLLCVTAACGGGSDASRADSTLAADSAMPIDNAASGGPGDSAINTSSTPANLIARGDTVRREGQSRTAPHEERSVITARGTGTPPATPDTVRGTVLEVGSAPATMVAIRPPGGAQISIAGSQLDALRRSAGADVWATGARDGNRMIVTSFRVRSVDGVSATDGRLVENGSAVAIVDAGGTRHAIPRPPDALRAHVGKRVWVSGPLDAVNAFGVIEP